MMMNAQQLLEKVEQEKANSAALLQERMAKVKEAIVNQAKKTVQNYLDKKKEFGNDFCIDIEASRLDEHVMAFLDTLPDELLLQGLFVQIGGIEREKVTFRSGIFNFAIEESILPKDRFNGKRYFGKTLKIQPLNFGVCIQRFFKNCMGMYPEQEVIKQLLAYVDNEGKLTFCGLLWGDFSDICEAKPTLEVYTLAQHTYAVFVDGEMIISCWGEALPENLQRYPEFVFDIRYVPKEKK